MSIKADPTSIHAHLSALYAGKTLELVDGDYSLPLVMSGKSGTQQAPIVVRGGADVRVGSAQAYADFRKTANELSAVQEAGGGYPGVYYLADNAALVLRDCQWLVIEDLSFRGCWPTAVYIDNCQHITLRGLDIRGGTFAIGATGRNTRHLLIEDCTWIQDINDDSEDDICSIHRDGRLETSGPGIGSALWKDIDWEDVHRNWQEDDGRRVDIDADHRGYDGDFFRAWTIAGYVIIRNNIIADAFNAVHFFNQAAISEVTKFSRNVLIENNWFIRIRDNTIEPEDYAWNWTIRHNKFIDCFGPFSFEMRSSGYFYIYGNLGWNRHKPGPVHDDHTTGQLFKFPKTHVDAGPHYVFNNSWILRGPIVKRMRFSNFVHVNNAVDYYEEGGERPPDGANPFGPEWREEDAPSDLPGGIPKAEGDRFTKQWNRLAIRFDGDVVNHPLFPDELRKAGYLIGATSLQASPAYLDPSPGRPEGLMMTTAYAAQPLNILLPDGQDQVAVDEGKSVGAWQQGRLLSVEMPLFERFWLRPKVPRAA
ncbi:right-handed parallel beta-helix repeat-containing protein (plasmid) [Rhizobium ruizarguesonis]|nr:right-handed parallel beta-helix repeat-containing protein [Rhizobium ruizarguesonis]